MICYICKSQVFAYHWWLRQKCEDMVRITRLRTGSRHGTVRMAELTRTQRTGAPSTLRLIAWPGLANFYDLSQGTLILSLWLFLITTVTQNTRIANLLVIRSVIFIRVHIKCGESNKVKLNTCIFIIKD